MQKDPEFFTNWFYTIVMVNYCLLGCLDIKINSFFAVVFFSVFIYAQTILYENPINDIL